MAKGKTTKQLPAKHREQQIVTTEIQGILAVIERAVLNPEIDINKMEKLLDLQERVMNKNAEISFNQSMARLQAKLPVITHDAELVHNNKVISTYARYESIDKIIRPLYIAEGFSISYNSKTNPNGTTTYFATLSHIEGHSRVAEMVLPDDKGGAKNSIQAVGSTAKYAMRYLVAMLFNLVTSNDQDDDGGAGAGPAAGKKGSRFNDRAEEHVGGAVDATALRVDPAKEGGDYSPELAEIGEDEIPDWDGRTIITGEKSKSVKDFESPEQACAYLKTCIGKHKSKAGRIGIITLNTALTRRLLADGKQGLVASLHQLADAGKE